MKLQDRNQVEKLSRFYSKKFPTTSFFLDTDKSRQTKKELSLTLKNLVAASRERLEAMNLDDKDKKDSLGRDLDKIQAFGEEQILASHHPGLAAFSCSAEGFWQDFVLADAPRNRLLIDQNPYVRPLTVILEGHPRLCILLLDRKEAQWYDVFMDEGRRVESLRSDVPTKIQPPGEATGRTRRPWSAGSRPISMNTSRRPPR